MTSEPSRSNGPGGGYSGLELALGGLLSRFVGVMERRARVVLAVAAAIFLACAGYAATHLGVNTAVDRMFTSSADFKTLYDDFARVFPILDEALLVVVDAETPFEASRAAEALGERLEARPELFRDVFIPGEGDFFHRNALLYLSTDELEDLADQLARIQPLLAELARDGSLHGLVSALAVAAEDAPADALESVDWPALLDRIDAGAEAALDGESETSWWQTVFLESFFPEDQPRRVLIVQPVLDYDRLLPGGPPIEAVRDAAAELGLDGTDGTRVRLTGNVALNHEEMLMLFRQAATALAFSVVLVALILSIGLSSPRLIASIVTTLLFGLVVTAAFAAATVVQLNMVSIAFGVLFVGLGVDFGIHLGMRYAEAIRQGFVREDAMDETARSIGASLVICAATTAVGFYVFVPTEFRAVAELGLIAGTGMFISLISNLTLLPALLTLGENVIVPDHRVWLDRIDRALSRFAQRNARSIRWVAVAVGVLCAVTLPHATFDHDVIRLRDPSSESVQTMNDLLADRHQSPWNIDVLAPDLESARALADRIERLDVVDHTVTILDYVPPDQEEKLEILADLALFLPIDPSFDPAQPAPSAEEQLALIADFRDALRDGWGARDDSPELAAAARRLAATLDRVLARADEEPAEAVLDRLESQLVGPLPDQLRRFWKALSPPEDGVTLADLPEALSSRMLAEDGRARIQVLPVENLQDRAAMNRFVGDVRSLHPEATGMAISVLETARVVVRSLREALITAALVIGLLLLFLWRRPSDALLVIAPLTLAAAMTGATSVLLDMPFNFANVIVLPLLLGIGADSGIHLVHRFHVVQAETAKGASGGEVLRTSTARAILFSALTTIASFGTMAFAGHYGLASLGRLLTIGIVYTVICNLIVLPAMMIGRQARADGDRAEAWTAARPRA
jgi:hopanoid biosynthesis associated RND transporter like protein HpnN